MAKRNPDIPTPKQLRRMGLFYMIMPLFLIWIVFLVFPPVPWPTREDEPEDENVQASMGAPANGGGQPIAGGSQTGGGTQPTGGTQTPGGAQTTAPPAAVGPQATGTQPPVATPTGGTQAGGGAPPAGGGVAPPAGGAAGGGIQPPRRSRAAANGNQKKPLVEDVPIKIIGDWKISTSLEERLLLLVIAAGALGSYIHGATSFADYVGNKKFYTSWTWWYLLRPMIGVSLALVLYFVVRGGFLLLVGNTAVEASDINPFGIAALAGLVGMFSKQATDKLDEVFSTLFKAAPGKGDDKRGGSLTGAPTPQAVNPDSGSTDGNTEVTITGTGFAEGMGVLFDDKPATNVKVVNASSLTALTPPHDPGTVDVTVSSADGQTGTLEDAYTYVKGEGENGPPPVEEEVNPEEEEAAAARGAAEPDEGGEAAAAAAAAAAAQAQPTITVLPGAGPPTGGTQVTIKGTGFADGATVAFGTSAPQPATFVDASTLTALTPPGQEGSKVDVTVTNPGGPAFKLPQGFEYSSEQG